LIRARLKRYRFARPAVSNQVCQTYCADQVADKTNWRARCSGAIPPVDLIAVPSSRQLRQRDDRVASAAFGPFSR
jgi:hypothetical protein